MLLQQWTRRNIMPRKVWRVALVLFSLQLLLLIGFHEQLCFALGKEVLVTGASGRTGRLVVEKLLERGAFGVRAFVRNEGNRRELLRSLPSLEPEKVFMGNILTASTLTPALTGCFALIIVTSAVPRIRLLSLAKTLLASLTGKKLQPKFRWKGGLKPEQVDWEGQRNQVDEALAAGVSRIVLVGSMGGTEPDNFLNSIGDGAGDQILLWKRKAEVYLIEECKKVADRVAYTILHPGGLTDTEGGERHLVAGVDDKLLQRPVRSIPRADVAEVCIQALDCQQAANRSFDICADAPGEGEPFGAQGLGELLAPLEGRSCDYAINPPPS